MVAPSELGTELNDRRAGKRACIVWHRRTGKDKTCFAQEMVPAMFERVGVYHYYFPTAAEWEEYFRNLGLGTTTGTTTTGTTTVKKAVTPAAVWQGKPRALATSQMQRWY